MDTIKKEPDWDGNMIAVPSYMTIHPLLGHKYTNKDRVVNKSTGEYITDRQNINLLQHYNMELLMRYDINNKRKPSLRR